MEANLFMLIFMRFKNENIACSSNCVTKKRSLFLRLNDFGALLTLERVSIASHLDTNHRRCYHRHCLNIIIIACLSFFTLFFISFHFISFVVDNLLLHRAVQTKKTILYFASFLSLLINFFHRGKKN